MSGEALRSTALHEAISFLLLRRDASPRLADVADVTFRLECYLRSGVLPLDAGWSSSDGGDAA